jgi:hypothetical protein
MVAFAPKVTIACLRQVVAFAPKVIKCAAYGVAQGRGGGMVGGIANDMYNNDVGKGVVYAYELEAYEAK